jgi:hypothetical protein
MSQLTKAPRAKAGRVAKPKPKHILTLGNYSLWAMPARNHEIRFWNPAAKVMEYKTAGTRDDAEAIKKLEKLYHGDGFCAHCGQAVAKDSDADADMVVNIIDAYLAGPASTKPSSASIKDRLAHVKRYIGTKSVRVGHVNEDWISAFRAWLKAEPYYRGKDAAPRHRGDSTVEGAVIQLKAAIRHAGKTANFKPKQPGGLVRKVIFRPDVPLMAAMFRYALAGGARRLNLLYYLRLSVATWGRPQAVLEADLTPSAQQWVSEAKVFRLNPEGRTQNHKYRAEVPVGPLVAAWLDTLPPKPIMASMLTNTTWAAMMAEIKPGLPDYAGGMKCIRRGMAAMCKRKLGRTNWIQGKFMGGWEQPNSIADGYAGDDLDVLHEEDMMGKALAATNEIIDEIEALVPGAFSAQPCNYPATSENIVALRG